MADRSKPTAQLITELTGGNQGLISSLHHGLRETPALAQIYPVLNLDELVAFAASSWKSRENDLASMQSVVGAGTLYQIFDNAFGIGFPWLNKNKNIVSPAALKKYASMNPFGYNLSNRLQSVGATSEQNLRTQLIEEPNTYVFECQYQNAKAMRGGNNHKLEVMHFQNVYPKSGKIVPAFAKEVARILADYPTEIAKID